MNAPVIAKKKSQRSNSANCPNEIRAAYPYFHEKRTKNSSGVPFTYPAGHEKAGQPNPRHSASFMFPKLHADPMQCPNYLWLWGLAVEAARKMWPQNVDAAGQWVWPQGAQFPVKDGDVPFVSKPKPGQVQASAEEIAKKNAWRRGYWIVEAENFLDSVRVAKVINGTEVELPAKVINGTATYKSGDFGIGNFHAYAYENSTFGIGYGFDGFCFTREGEAIGASGPRSVSQMFGGVAGMVPQSAPAMPGAPAVPPQTYAPNPSPLPAGAVAQPQYAAPAAPMMPPAAPAAPVYAAPAVPLPPMPGAPPLAPAAAPMALPPPMPGAAPMPPAGLPAFPTR